VNTAQFAKSESSAGRQWGAATPLRFLIASAVAAVVNFFSRILINLYVNFPTAIVGAYCFGILTAFTLNRRFVFRHSSRPLHVQAAWFVSINLLALAQTLAISLLLADFLLPKLGIHLYKDEIAHGIGLAVPMFSSYLGHRYITFR